jgi:archaellin
MSSGLEMATEKVFKIGLFMSTLSILGAPTLNMMMATFMMGQATTFQDAIVNEAELVYAGKLKSINQNLVLPKNTSVNLFGNDGGAESITINVTTPLGSSGEIKKRFPTKIYRDGGDAPSLSESETQCFTIETWRDKAYAFIKVKFTKRPC